VGLVSRVDVLRQQEEISRLLYEMPKRPSPRSTRAAGAGLSIALAADLRIASDQARLGTAFARVGFSGDFGGTWLLQRLVGPGRAKELYFSAELLPAQRALELGLVTKVVPHESFWDETMGWRASSPLAPPLRSTDEAQLHLRATNTLADTLTVEAENMTASGRRGPQERRPRLRREARAGVPGPLIAKGHDSQDAPGTALRRVLALASRDRGGARWPHMVVTFICESALSSSLREAP